MVCRQKPRYNSNDIYHNLTHIPESQECKHKFRTMLNNLAASLRILRLHFPLYEKAKKNHLRWPEIEPEE